MTPARQALEPRLLAAAPELGALALLDHALAICAIALLAEHPTLAHDLAADLEPPTLLEARRLLAAADRVRRAGARYRAAVLDALAPPAMDHDTLPF